METVDLVASGYDWACPGCEKFNHVIELNETVICAGCKKEYEVKEVHHAY